MTFCRPMGLIVTLTSTRVRSSVHTLTLTRPGSTDYAKRQHLYAAARKMYLVELSKPSDESHGSLLHVLIWVGERAAGDGPEGPDNVAQSVQERAIEAVVNVTQSEILSV
jgi:hypothetical protein